MTLITLVSVSGSPGVSTITLGLSEWWPRPTLVVEADPTGGSGMLAGLFRGEVEPPGGLLEVVTSHRNGQLRLTPDVLLPLPGGRSQLLPGIRAHTQARSLGGVWEPLFQALRSLSAETGQDVLIDGGRLGLAGWPEPLVRGSDMTLLVTRSSLPALAAARSWTEALRHDTGTLGLLVVDPGRPYSAREVATWLRVPVFGEIAWDPAAAAVLSDGAPRPRRFERTVLVRSLRASVDGLRARTVAVDDDQKVVNR